MPLERKVFKVAAEHIHDLPTHIVTSGWWGEVWWGGRVHAADTKHTHTHRSRAHSNYTQTGVDTGSQGGMVRPSPRWQPSHGQQMETGFSKAIP